MITDGDRYLDRGNNGLGGGEEGGCYIVTGCSTFIEDTILWTESKGDHLQVAGRATAPREGGLRQ